MNVSTLSLLFNKFVLSKCWYSVKIILFQIWPVSSRFQRFHTIYNSVWFTFSFNFKFVMISATTDEYSSGTCNVSHIESLVAFCFLEISTSLGTWLTISGDVSHKSFNCRITILNSRFNTRNIIIHSYYIENRAKNPRTLRSNGK